MQEHSKIYEVMQKSQEKQFHSFEEEWKTYLKEFRGETVKRLHETKYLKKEKIIQEENRFLSKLKKSAVLTSPWLRQLIEKKKWLIHEKKFEEAIDVGHEINRERLKLNDFREEANEVVLNKKLGKLANKTNRYI